MTRKTHKYPIIFIISMMCYMVSINVYGKVERWDDFGNSSSTGAQDIKIYPNPATDYLILDIHLDMQLRN